jgi:geranylgeranyl pyrophosphate synthase/predicted secreted hydrolase
MKYTHAMMAVEKIVPAPEILPAPLMVIPEDWPTDGPIDLMVHDLPHKFSTTEWWYLNCHLVDDGGHSFSLFAAFFRLVVGYNEQTGEPVYSHSLNWALSDLGARRYYAHSLLDPAAPAVGLQRLERGEGMRDPRLRRALREVLEQDRVPLPDRLLSAPAVVDACRLDLDYDGNRLVKLDSGSYRLELVAPEYQIRCELIFTPAKPFVRHGDAGVVRGTAGEHMFYYFTPRCHVEGTLALGGGQVLRTEGTGWYDHEFGRSAQGQVPTPWSQEIAWNWLSAQLDDGTELSVYDLFDVESDADCGRWAVVIDAAGTPTYYDDFRFEPLRDWTSTRTFNSYPTCWRLEIPAAQICLTAEASFDCQEFITLIAPPAFWEGRVEVSGRAGGRTVTGRGYVERSGVNTVPDLERFFAAVGKATRRAVTALLPRDPTRQEVRRLIAGSDRDHYLDGIDVAQLAETLIRPIREVIDRGGKAWRSYGLLAAIDVVGGDSQPFADWLAIPELLHVGSLIVDDVEDRSAVRRGGPACHILHGEAVAINAGTAAYFLSQPLLLESGLGVREQLRIYECYFEALRAAHAGQALDIAGLGALMPEVVNSGDGALLRRRLLAIHHLKAAVPPRSLAAMGAALGGGSAAQVAALADFFELLGLAFQIIDDMLNLRGFQGDLKLRGEDIASGKVTMPVAEAMDRLPLDERRALWAAIAAQPQEPSAVAAIIAQLEACGALDACVCQANQLVETGWAALDQVIPDSYTKVMLRAFSWYVLERTY